MTKTFTTMTVSEAVYDEVKATLVAAEYFHCLKPDLIEMDGLALIRAKAKAKPRASKTLPGRDGKRGKVLRELEKWLQETYGVVPNSQQLAAIDKILSPLT